jgi:hypothetical protein
MLNIVAISRNATAAAMLGREFVFRLTLSGEDDGADECQDGDPVTQRPDASSGAGSRDGSEMNGRRPLYRVDAVGLPNLNVMLAQQRAELSTAPPRPNVQ